MINCGYEWQEFEKRKEAPASCSYRVSRFSQSAFEFGRRVWSRKQLASREKESKQRAERKRKKRVLNKGSTMSMEGVPVD
jgi:hypothetical protein